MSAKRKTSGMAAAGAGHEGDGNASKKRKLTVRVTVRLLPCYVYCFIFARCCAIDSEVKEVNATSSNSATVRSVPLTI